MVIVQRPDDVTTGANVREWLYVDDSVE